MGIGRVYGGQDSAQLLQECVITVRDREDTEQSDCEADSN